MSLNNNHANQNLMYIENENVGNLQPKIYDYMIITVEWKDLFAYSLALVKL